MFWSRDDGIERCFVCGRKANVISDDKQNQKCVRPGHVAVVKSSPVLGPPPKPYRPVRKEK